MREADRQSKPLVVILLLLFMASSLSAQLGSTCAGCHAEIVRKYNATGMARSSGKTGTGGFHESFSKAEIQDASGAQYKISNSYVMQFQRESAGVLGQRALNWFIGSGNVGRSYLFESDGFLFQAPVSYYTSRSAWDISPGYQRSRNIELSRLVETRCLQCHASGLNPVADFQNKFGQPPFLENGVSCERCHGSGTLHVEKMKKGEGGSREIINPAKLEPAQRDSVCAQCHLTGVSRVARRIREPFRPGALLSDSIAVFVWKGSASELNATSHYERLRQSACQRVSGEKLWCGTCHDPHQEPEATKRVAYYRERCVSCHKEKSCKEVLAVRRKVGDDCTSCHMPKSNTRTMEHVAFTDHSISRRAKTQSFSPVAEKILEPFWKVEMTDRDYAMGYATVAPAEASVRQRAFTLLQKSANEDPADAVILSQLAQFYDRMGQEEKAMELCRKVLQIDATNSAVAMNLGTYVAKRGNMAEAIALWKQALLGNPSLTGARLNLGIAQYRNGDVKDAEETLKTALSFAPDNEAARRMLTEIQAVRKD